MMAFANLRVLVLAPHTDDAELGCGGTMARILEEGGQVFVAVFSIAEDSLPPGVPPTTLEQEFFEAASRMGVPDANLFVHRYPVRRFSYDRQSILENLVRLKKQIEPHLVLLPASTDVHQDHRVVYEEGIRAFKEISVWGYELPWNHTSFAAESFVELNERHLRKKWDALEAYRSQVALGRPYFSWDFIMGLARVRGTQIKAEFAEAFEVLRFRIPRERR
jgi:LmbE family N-acetylglucosaminyl deacetylase